MTGEGGRQRGACAYSLAIPDALRSMSSRPLSLFFSYAHADREMRAELDKYLGPLKKDGRIQGWHDGEIKPGERWDAAIRKKLNEADVLLLLLSPAFLDSDYIARVELAHALDREAAGTARVIPILLRDCLWDETPLADLQILPEGAEPVEDWDSPQKAYVQVARAIAQVVADLRTPGTTRLRSGRWTIPNPTRRFTGRTVLLDRIAEALAGGGPIALTALHGLGGIGKSQLALAYARGHRNEYDIGWLIRAETPGELVTDLNDLAVELDLAKPTDSPDATMAALRDWWRAHPGWLLIYDNAPNAEALAGRLPEGGDGHVLITSRDPTWLGTAEAIEVDVMNRDEAIDFLLARSGVGDDQREDAGRLADALGRLPLALEQAAATIEQDGLGVGAYLRLFEERRAALFAESPPNPAYPKSVATTWSLAFERAAAEEPAAVGFLRLCACLAPDDLPVDLIRQWDGTWPGPLDDARQDDLAWTRVIRALRRHSLVKIEGEALSVHRLVQVVTWDRMDEGEREVWATAAQRRMGDALDLDMPTMSGRLDEIAALIPHALAAGEFEGGDSGEKAWILDRAATFSQLRADFSEAEALFRRALDISEAARGSDHPTVASRANNLGGVLQARGELDGAESAYRRALAIDEAAHGPDHPNVAIRMNNLGGVLRARGDLDGAKAAYRRALTIDEAAYGTDHPDVAIDVNNLGRVLQDRGDLDGAEAAYRRALAILDAKLGPDHPNTQLVRDNLAAVRAELAAGGASGTGDGDGR